MSGKFEDRVGQTPAFGVANDPQAAKPVVLLYELPSRGKSNGSVRRCKLMNAQPIDL
jgi:hypothetical protein